MTERASVPDVCNALAELGYEPRRSTNAAISPDEALAVASRLRPAPSVLKDDQIAAAALNWIERRYLEELGMGLVIDAPNDGKYYVCGDSGTTHYGKTLREAVASAIAEGV